MKAEEIKKPAGINYVGKDTIEDCFNRADGLASPTHYSGMLLDRKDLRRIVLLVYELRKLQSQLEKEREFEVDFHGYVKARIKVTSSSLIIDAAMNGYGDSMDISKIKITQTKKR